MHKVCRVQRIGSTCILNAERDARAIALMACATDCFSYFFENIGEPFARSCRGCRVPYRVQIFIGAIVIKETTARRPTACIFVTPTSPAAPVATKAAGDSGAVRGPTARASMHMPARAGAAPGPVAAPAVKVDARDFELASAGGAKVATAKSGMTRSKGPCVSASGGSSGTSGGSGGADYPPSEEENGCPLCKASSTPTGSNAVTTANGRCKHRRDDGAA